jgi:Uma2 family endonuclease
MLLLNPKNLQPAEDQRLVLYDITWQQYEQFSNLFDNNFVKMIYLEGVLEIIMSNSPEHERLKKIIARLVEAYAEECNIELNGYGSATFRNQAARRGVEPDECYCVGTLNQVPDIAIEIVLTSGGIDKLEVYRGLGVREVWFWVNQQLSFSYLADSNENYIQNPRSVLLPDLDPVLLSSFVSVTNQTQAVRNYRQALQQS